MPFSNAFSQIFIQYEVIAWVVFGLVMVALFTVIVVSWRRGRRGLGPSQRNTADRTEMSYIAALVGIAIFLTISSFAANAKDFPGDPPRPMAQVRVLGYQWCWRFSYEGTPVTVNGQCEGNDVLLPVLVVPVGQPVRLDVISADVVHAVWVPQWRFKLYAYPGFTQHLTITIPRPGRWIGRCAQLCGIFHYKMDFYLQAVSPAAFRTFLRTGAIP
jgi:cytochrome c oxidase subunit II